MIQSYKPCLPISVPVTLWHITQNYYKLYLSCYKLYPVAHVHERALNSHIVMLMLVKC